MLWLLNVLIRYQQLPAFHKHASQFSFWASISFASTNLYFLAECCDVNNFPTVLFVISPSASWIQGPCCVHHAGKEGV